MTENEPSITTIFGTCRFCRGSIVSHGAKNGWYHTERDLRYVYPHFAEPLERTA